MLISAHKKYALCDWKSPPKFICEVCDYSCNKMSLWKQHVETKKHKKLSKTEFSTHGDQISCGAKKCSKNMPHHVCKCGKVYKHIQSYNRHKKACRDKKQESEKNELRGMIASLIRQNENMITENRDMREILKDVIPKIGNNNTTITNKFNLQLFLNEQCKDAINLSEFVETLELGLADLDETRRNGYVSGISSIIVRGLKELDLHKRPIHCCDLKRDILYVKDDDKWEKDDNENRKIKQAITVVANKQFDKIKDWEENNPNWNLTDAGTQSYIEMVKELTTESDKTNNRIIKSIAKEVIIEK